MHWDTLKQDNYSTVRRDGGGRVSEVQAGTTSPMPEHKGFKLQQLSRDPLTPADGPGSVSVKDRFGCKTVITKFYIMVTVASYVTGKITNKKNMTGNK